MWRAFSVVWVLHHLMLVQSHQIASGVDFACAITDQQQTVCWGPYLLDIGGYVTAVTSAPTDKVFVDISAGDYHACGMDANGAVTCWGDPTGGFSTFPTHLLYKQVSVFGRTTCGLLFNSSVVCAGASFPTSVVPVDPSITHISVGGQRFCALSEDGSVLELWSFSLGTSVVTQLPNPFPDFAMSVCVPSADYSTVCGLDIHGQVVCTACTVDIHGDVTCTEGVGGPTGYFVDLVSASTNSYCGIAEDGSLSCWNAHPVPLISKIPFIQVSVSASGDSGCVIDAQSNIQCWSMPDPPTLQTQRLWLGEHNGFLTNTIGCGQKTYGTIKCFYDSTVFTVGPYQDMDVGPVAACGIRSDNTLECTFLNDTVMAVPNVQITAIAVDDDYYCAIRQDDSSIICSENIDDYYYGLFPVPGTFSSIKCRDFTCCMISADDGSAFCSNFGFFTITVPGPFASFAVGGTYFCGVYMNGTVTCVDVEQFSPPLSPPGEALSVAVYQSANAITVRVDGSLQCTGPCSSVVLPTATNFVQVQCTYDVCCALDVTKTVTCFGSSFPWTNFDLGQLAPQFSYTRVGNQSRPCQPGTYSFGPGSVNPLCSGRCAAGYYGNGVFTSSTCAGGCQPGFFCPAQSVQPTPCPAGTFGIIPHLQDNTCSGECPRGFYCLNQTINPTTPCPGGRYGASPGSKTALCDGPCQAGYMCPIGSITASPFACSPGTFSNAGQETCSFCPAGSYGPNHNQTSCLTCTAGSYCLQGLSVPYPCAPGSYSSANQSVCTSCGAGTFAALPGATACDTCVAGSSCLPGAFFLQPCFPGTYSESNQTACQQCDLGTFATTANQTACHPCDAGKFTPSRGATTCADCSGTILNNVCVQDASTSVSLTALIAGVASAGGVLLLGIIIGCICYRRRINAFTKGAAGVLVEPGEVVLGSILGTGVAGIVYKARWHESTVAAKKLKSQSTAKDKENFAHEVRMHELLGNHPSVVLFLGSCQTDLNMTILLAYMPYKSVEDYVINQRACPLHNVTPVQLINSLRVLSKIVADAASAMVHCHEKNVIHGDIAARNFLVSKELNAFICDFGMSRELAPGQTISKGVLEEQVPVKWTSPEVLSDRLYSFKSDVYAFGMFLLEVVSLGEPWAGEHLSNRVIGDCIVDPQSPRHRPAIPGFCPRQLADLMRACWADDVNKRPSAKEISKVLEEFQRNCSDATVDDLARIYQPENPAQVPQPQPPRAHESSTASVSKSASSNNSDDMRYGTYTTDGSQPQTSSAPTSGDSSPASGNTSPVNSNTNSGGVGGTDADDSRYEVYRVHHTPSMTSRGGGGYIELQSV